MPPFSVDLVTVAQAVHWFDRTRFYAAASAVLVPGGLIAVWTYDLLLIAPDLDEIIARLYYETLRAYWPSERRLVDERYATLDFPFDEISVPVFRMRQSWTLPALLAYLGTWSGVGRIDSRKDAIRSRRLRRNSKRCGAKRQSAKSLGHFISAPAARPDRPPGPARCRRGK